MSDAEAKFAEVRRLHPSATMHSESNVPVVLLPDFKFRAGGASVQMSLLLYPAKHSGYITRLFFERKLEGCGQSNNWTQHTVLSRAWWAPSWKEVTPEQPWVGILGAHLRSVA